MLHLLHVSPESPTDSECLVLSVKTTNRWVVGGDWRLLTGHSYWEQTETFIRNVAFTSFGSVTGLDVTRCPRSPGRRSASAETSAFSSPPASSCP